MDENKLEKLREIEYTVRRVCGNCMWSRESTKRSGFTTCKNRELAYEHKKHSYKQRELSIHISGWCKHHIWQEDNGMLGTFTQFKED